MFFYTLERNKDTDALLYQKSSTAWLMKGDTLTVRQLLIALMLPSGNDAAYTLAANTGKTIAGDNSLSNQQAIQIFMDKVNEKAKAIGVTDSNFVVPDGYDAEGQLELSGIPYVGCDIQSSVICMDKSLAYMVSDFTAVKPALNNLSPILLPEAIPK